MDFVQQPDGVFCVVVFIDGGYEVYIQVSAVVSSWDVYFDFKPPPPFRINLSAEFQFQHRRSYGKTNIKFYKIVGFVWMKCFD